MQLLYLHFATQCSKVSGFQILRYDQSLTLESSWPIGKEKSNTVFKFYILRNQWCFRGLCAGHQTPCDPGQWKKIWGKRTFEFKRWIKVSWMKKKDKRIRGKRAGVWKWGHLKWTPIQYDWCPYKHRRLRQILGREGHMRSWRKD